MNVSATLNVLRLIKNPPLCLPHATISTFNDLPVPLSDAFGKLKPDIRAVVLDKDNCFAKPKENVVYKPYTVGHIGTRTQYFECSTKTSTSVWFICRFQRFHRQSIVFLAIKSEKSMIHLSRYVVTRLSPFSLPLNVRFEKSHLLNHLRTSSTPSLTTTHLLTSSLSPTPPAPPLPIHLTRKLLSCAPQQTSPCSITPPRNPAAASRSSNISSKHHAVASRRRTRLPWLEIGCSRM